MKRTTEFILGLLGGIFGFGAAIFAILFGAVDQAVNQSTLVTNLGYGAVASSLIGIVGAILVKFRPKFGGILMIISAIAGVISVSVFYALSALLLLIGGVMGLIRKDSKST